MSLQELAYQLLAPPVQFPFEFALAHLPGFVGGEEGFGIREDSSAPPAAPKDSFPPLANWNPVVRAITGLVLDGTHMITRRMTRSELDYFKSCGGRQWKWWRWPVTLSCNGSDAVWPSTTYGHTPYVGRDHLEGHLALLNEIVADILRERPNGGRFHIDDAGAFFGGQSAPSNGVRASLKRCRLDTAQPGTPPLRMPILNE